MFWLKVIKEFFKLKKKELVTYFRYTSWLDNPIMFIPILLLYTVLAILCMLFPFFLIGAIATLIYPTFLLNHAGVGEYVNIFSTIIVLGSYVAVSGSCSFLAGYGLLWIPGKFLYSNWKQAIANVKSRV